MSDDDKRVFATDAEGRTRVEDARDTGDDARERALREMTFSTHLISLNAMALMNLGLLGEGDDMPPPDREAARHVIDTLAILREKTQGNLTADEQRLLDGLLYDLRLKFVETRGK